MTPQRNETKGLWAYFVLTYALVLLSWGLMAVFQLPGASVAPHAPRPAPGTLLLFFLGGFSPSIAGIVMTWRVGGWDGLRDLWKRMTRFNIGWQWYAAILLPMLVFGVRVAVQLVRGGTFVESPLLTQLLSLISFTIPIIVFGPLSEEFGWRGFVLDRLLIRWSALRASLILGVLWACWHFPLFFIPGTTQQVQGSPLIAFPIFAVLIIAQTIVITWIYINTGHSLFAAMVFHFTINWFGSFAPTMIAGGMIDRLIHSAAYVIVVAVIVWWWQAGRTAEPQPQLSRSPMSS